MLCFRLSALFPFFGKWHHKFSILLSTESATLSLIIDETLTSLFEVPFSLRFLSSHLSVSLKSLSCSLAGSTMVSSLSSSSRWAKILSPGLISVVSYLFTKLSIDASIILDSRLRLSLLALKVALKSGRWGGPSHSECHRLKYSPRHR